MDQNRATTTATGESATSHRARTALRWSAMACYAAIGFGQILFIAFIALFFYASIFAGNFAAWNGKPHIAAYVQNDGAGNAMFAVHVLLAAVMVAGGLLQLIPALRQRWPGLHRWNGRIFVISALALAIGGLWLVWVRGSYLNLTGAFGISFCAALIIVFAAMAWRAAINRQFAAHRRWALRLFVVANAVWFMRIGYMIWGIGSGGVGIGPNMDGSFDYFLAFGNSLVPLGVMEIYLRVGAGRSDPARYAMAATLGACALLIFAGSGAAWLVMWGPYV